MFIKKREESGMNIQCWRGWRLFFLMTFFIVPSRAAERAFDPAGSADEFIASLERELMSINGYGSVQLHAPVLATPRVDITLADISHLAGLIPAGTFAEEIEGLEAGVARANEASEQVPSALPKPPEVVQFNYNVFSLPR